MSILLRISAAVAAAWGILLLFGLSLLTAEPTAPLMQTVARAHAVGLLVLAGLFVRASANPQQHHAIVYGAIAFTVGKIVINLIGLLGDLPPEPGVFFLVDLLASVALLVGLLESLPRTVRPPQHDAGER